MKVTFISISALMIVALAGCDRATSSQDDPVVLDSTELIARGSYLVGVIGCNDCHSPKVMTDFGPAPDPSRLLSGFPQDEQLPSYDPASIGSWVLFTHQSTATVGPWGVSFAANITSDGTGIGYWSNEQFKRAMTEGKFKGIETARTLLPPMPWPSYAQLNDEDLRAIFAYLQSTPPVRNVVPAPIAPNMVAMN